MSFENKTVLVVDDSMFQREILKEFLEELGVGKILLAKDGLEGIRSAKYHNPDLILLDLQMPNIDGFQTTEKIRLFANKFTMPIIILTGMEDVDKIARIYELGANDFFEKPYNIEEVKTRITFYLDYSETIIDLDRFKNSMEQDLLTAEHIQKATTPDISDAYKSLLKFDIDFHAYNGERRLGGDSWGIFHLECGAPVFFIFDVTGHGINAALNNSFINSLVKSEFKKFKHLTADDFNPQQLLIGANAILCEELQEATFCAAACFIIHDDKCRYAACGLPELISIDMKTNEIEKYSCNGLPMGITDINFNPSMGQIEFTNNTLLWAMTDGLIESPSSLEKDRSDPIDDYILPGERLLDKCFKNLKLDMKAKIIIENIIKTFETNKFDMAQDDITLLAIKR